MKRILALLTLALVASACSLSAPTPPPRGGSDAPPTALPAQTQGGGESAPTVQPSAPQSPAEGAPASTGGEIDVAGLTETDTDLMGIYKTVPRPYDDFIQAGGRVVNLEPMGTFFVLWVPDGYESMATRRVMVIAHGHGGNGYRELDNELEFARKYGYAIVAIQWGNSDGTKMYSGAQFYEFMDTALQYMAYKYNTQVDKCAYRGWSLGSEISFEVTYLDKTKGTNYLALIIAHDGGIRPDVETMSVGKDFARDLYAGVYGDRPFEGAHFYLYAGNDEQIAHMKNTEQVLTAFGGVVEQLVLDEGAGHDGFYRHPQYHEEALQIFFRLAP